MSVKEYKCPCCGGNLVFNSDTQKLHCPSCDNEMDMETYREYAKVVERKSVSVFVICSQSMQAIKL